MVRYINKTEFKTKIGKFYCLWENGVDGIIVLFLGCRRKNFHEVIKKMETKHSTSEKISLRSKESRDIEDKITRYLNGRVKNLDFKIDFLSGTLFQKKIWIATASIPYGRTVSYREVAELAGFKKAWRAAGSALNKNPIMLIVPCHRVIRSNGDFGRFGGGEKLKVKEFLIMLEKENN
jgi:O-6-methylguanine DNA methyltransferase